jgi:glycosyltransferase involved in cell wall biosynthesis
MRIAIISDWFAEKMGYAENCLPKALAALGHEVHLITSNVQIYFNSPNYRETYEPFIGPPVVPCEVKELSGYTLHRLPHEVGKRGLRIQGLRKCLRALRPDVVQTFEMACTTTYEAALAKPLVGYKLFLESHLHASVFPLATARPSWRERARSFVRWAIPGKLVGAVSEKCYPISTDAADIAERFFGIPAKKIEVCSLGVDTDLFRPCLGDEAVRRRAELRKQLGFSDAEVVCVYTGRFAPDKGPACLARSVASLVEQGHQYRALFVGGGTPAQVEELRSAAGSVVHAFVPVQDLPPFYWAADVGVWPMQESTSQLDAAACGLPIIVSNRVEVRERVEGNGLFYEEGSTEDLARQLLALASPAVRRELGEHGTKKMREHFSWLEIARRRAGDYAAACVRGKA